MDIVLASRARNFVAKRGAESALDWAVVTLGKESISDETRDFAVMVYDEALELKIH